MLIINRVPFEYVVQAWLSAEWYSKNFDNFRNLIPNELINSQDLNNNQENTTRLNLLRSTRSPMIDTIPNNTIWYKANLNFNDIKRTYIVPSNDWATISANTYHPLKIVENLNLQDDHAAKINNIKEGDINQIDKRIILVCSSLDSVLTIIEGNHRAIAFIKDGLDKNKSDPFLEEVIIGVSPDMKNYEFHIEKYFTSTT